jgi:N-acetylglucosaminyl-diphospho-decaprenol L-rhamnosyltransferase
LSLVRRELFTRLEGFDEGYLAYPEEVDFALRPRRPGAHSYSLKAARVFHTAGVSTNQVRATRPYQSLRCRLLCAYWHRPRWEAVILLAFTFTAAATVYLPRAALRGVRCDVAATAATYRRFGGDVLSHA